MIRLTRVRMALIATFALVAVLAAVGCARDESQSAAPDAPIEQRTGVPTVNVEDVNVNNGAADVVRIDVQGEPGAYTFAVTVASADTGCDAYADWWEVLSADGALLYRRTLAHSHVGEQPFLRAGGPIVIDAEKEVVVRAHMSTTGYGGIVLRGSANGGFGSDIPDADFAIDVERIDPQPPPCAF